MLKGASGAIRHNDHLKCFIGAAQTVARVRVIGVKEIDPGDEGWLQLEFEAPLLAERGDHLILRRPSPPETIAGGVVLNAAPARRYKRFSEATLKTMRLMDSGSEGQILLAKLEANCPIPLSEFVKGCGMEGNAARRLIEQMSDEEIIPIRSDKEREPLLVTAAYWTELQNRIRGKLNEIYQAHPLRSGVEKNELVNYLKINPKQCNLMLRQLVNEGMLAETDGSLGIEGRQVVFSQEQQKAVEAILAEYSANPFSPPSSVEMMKTCDPDLLPAMIDKKMLIPVSEDIAFLPETYDRMVAEIETFLQQNTTITLAQVRDMFQTSRKYALAILEHLDRIQVTQRQDDYRILNRS
jgi:selenocysteine-specific elongation factor